MEAGSALRCLTSLLFSLGGACQRIGCAPSQALEAHLDGAHDTIVPDASSSMRQLNGACVSGRQTTGQRTNDVFFSGSWSPTCGTQEIREDDHGVATDGIIRPGPKVCDRPSLESRCLALVRTCTLSLASAASATVCQGAYGARPCCDKCRTPWPSTDVFTSCTGFFDSGATLRTNLRPLSPPLRPRRAARSGALSLVGQLPALPRPRRPSGPGESALAPIARPDACSPSHPRAARRTSTHGPS